MYREYFCYIFFIFWGQSWRRGTNDRLWVRFSFNEMNYLIFSFSHSGTELKRGVEFRHSTYFGSRIRLKVGHGKRNKNFKYFIYIFYFLLLFIKSYYLWYSRERPRPPRSEDNSIVSSTVINTARYILKGTLIVARDLS